MAGVKAVLELGTSKIVCLIDATGARDLPVRGASCVRYDGIRESRWVDETSLSTAIRTAIEEAEDSCHKQIRSLSVRCV